jgi:hypothetical protein
MAYIHNGRIISDKRRCRREDSVVPKLWIRNGDSFQQVEVGNGLPSRGRADLVIERRQREPVLVFRIGVADGSIDLLQLRLT